MGKTGWGEVDKQRGADSRFLQVGDGEIKTVRLLDDEPYTVLVHQVRGEVSGQGVFRSIQATDSPDDDWIDQMTNRFPPVPRHAMRCIEIDDDGEIQGICVLMGGVQIFRPLKAAFLRFGDVTSFDFAVSRIGEEIETEWDVAPCPESFDVDMEEWQAELAEDDTFAWEALFPPITPEEQEQIVEESGIDIEHDPVEALAAEMDLEEAEATRLTFGKFGPQKQPPHGLTVGEALAVEPSWVTWAAYNVTSHDQEVAACRVMVEAKAMEAPKKKKALKAPKKKKAASKRAAEPADDEEAPTREDWTGAQSVEDYLARWFEHGGKRVPLALAILEGEGETWPESEDEPEDDEPEDEPEEEEEEDDEPEDESEEEEEEEEEDDEPSGRQAVIDEITEIFAEQYSDTSAIIAVVKKFGAGNPRLRDLKDKQLDKLLAHLHEEPAPVAKKKVAKKKVAKKQATKKAMKKKATRKKATRRS